MDAISNFCRSYRRGDTSMIDEAALRAALAGGSEDEVRAVLASAGLYAFEVENAIMDLMPAIEVAEADAPEQGAEPTMPLSQVKGLIDAAVADERARAAQDSRCAWPTGEQGQGDAPERAVSDAAWERAKADAQARLDAAAAERLTRVRAGLPANPSGPTEALVTMRPDQASHPDLNAKPNGAAAWSNVIAKMRADK